MSPPLTDPGVPSYVGIAGPTNGYVKRGYQKYYSTGTTLTPGEPGYQPPGTPPQQGVPFTPPPTPGAIGGGITEQWPTVPPTLPPETCPPLNSVWSSGPTEPSADQIGYTPPVSNPNDDGLTFPVSFSDVRLKQEWHGVASTINPVNLTIYQRQLDQIVHDAVASANSSKQMNFPSVGGTATGTINVPVSPFYDIQVAVEMAVLKEMLQGTGLWFELVLKPLTNGPFANYYVVDTTPLQIPMGINLSA